VRLIVTSVQLAAQASPATGDIWFATPFLNYRTGAGTQEVVAAGITQTISGQKTFSTGPILSDATFAAQIQTQLEFNSFGSPTAVGRLSRSGGVLEFHTGGGVVTLLSDAAQTLTTLWQFNGVGASLTVGDELQFTNASGNATATGRLRRNVGNLTWHDGTAGRVIMNLESAQTITGIKTISAAFAYGDGVKQTFNPNGTNAGINVGSNAGDPSTLADGDLWTNSTTNALRARINGVSQTITAPGWRFVSKTTVGSAVQTVTISSLDGNTDVVYMVIIRFKGTSGTSSRLDVRPNGVTTNLSGATAHSDGTTFTQAGIGTEIPVMGSIVEATASIEVLIHCATGQIRTVASRYQGNNTGGGSSFVGNAGGKWDETATNITSLVFRTASGSDINPGTEFVIYALRQS
jgi:hypothetical protein